MRLRVLRAALVAIAEEGAENVRIQDIASRAGVSPGHVMYYFGRRERILVETLLMSEVDLAGRRERGLRRTSEPWKAIARFPVLYLPRGAGDVRWTLWAQVAANPPDDAETRRRLGACVGEWADALAGLVERGVAAGTFRDVDAGDFALRHCWMMDGLALNVLLGVPGRGTPYAVAVTRRSMERELRQPVG